MSKPCIAELLIASGHTDFNWPLVQQAIQTLYGDVGANLDERDWSAIMAANNPMAVAEQALKDQWQDAAYLLRNADHLISQGYSPVAVEFTYRQMAERLDFTYEASWSAGTQYEWLGALSDEELAARAAAEAAAAEVPRISLEFTDTTANLDVSHAGTLSFSVAGASEAVNGGDVALTPGASLKEGFVTVTRDSGAATTTDEYVVVGTNTAMNTNFNTASTVVDRLIIMGSGNDTIRSGGGNDTIYGGGGDDELWGNAGNDVIRAGTGADTIQPGRGNDTVFGDAGADTIFGGSEGNDRLTGGAEPDTFWLPNDGTWVDTITDFVWDFDNISVTAFGMEGLEPLSAIGTQTATTSAGAVDSIEIADNDVHYVSMDGQAGALTTGSTATLTSADLTASTLTNLAAYLDERFTNVVATGASGDVDAIMVVNWTAPSSTTSYVYEFTENAASVNISASELALLGIVERSNVILMIGDIT